jgi:hypothetical protein
MREEVRHVCHLPTLRDVCLKTLICHLPHAILKLNSLSLRIDKPSYHRFQCLYNQIHS